MWSNLQRKFRGCNGIQTHDFAMLYWLSYEASPDAANCYKLNLHLTCFRRGFIAQLSQSVEHHTGIAEVRGYNPFEASAIWALFITTA